MGKKDSPHVRVWEFQVRPGARKKFERIYGPQGEWVQLFEKGKGYLRTELFRDAEKRGRFLTVDYWISKDDYENFRRTFDDDFETLDKKYQSLCAQETLFGTFFPGAGQKAKSKMRAFGRRPQAATNSV